MTAAMKPAGRIPVPARIGAAVLAAILALALLAPVVSVYKPLQTDLGGALRGPSAGHPFGQDRLGRDVFSQVAYGARASMIIAIAVVTLTVIVGVAAGAAAGYLGGGVDVVTMRVVDIFLAFPGILLAIALAGVLGPNLVNLVIALAAMGWVGYARLVRAQVLGLREREYVAAARAVGAGPWRVVARHILPNALSPVIVQATFSAAGVIIAESSLSFLGLGPQDVPTWGGLLSQGAAYLLYAPHIAFFPGLFIMLTVLALNLVGDALRDALDPKSR
ncbi:MAG: ABC transporter permease [Candidatus Methylomirabilia bacterium]